MAAQALKGDVPAKWVFEPKLDGIRVIAQKYNGIVSIYTRTMNNKTASFPHLESALSRVPFDFALDGEMVSVAGVAEVEGQSVPVSSFANVSSVFSSSSSRAVAQQRSSKLTFVVFDCLSAKGQDVTKMPDSIRRNMAALVVDLLQTMTPYIMLIPRWRQANGNGLYEEIVRLGGEGLIAKNPVARYWPGKRPANTWLKIKANQTADVVIMGYKPGKGKYEEQIGAVEFGQYKNGRLVPRSRCSGMTDAQRLEFSKNPEAYIGRVMEIKFFGKTGDNSFRHPVYLRLRDDKPAEECIWD